MPVCTLLLFVCCRALRCAALCYVSLCCAQLQRDTLQALQQQPSNLISSLTALAQQQQLQAKQQAQAQQQEAQQQQRQRYSSGSTLEQQGYESGTACAYCQGLTGDSQGSSICSCQAGGARSLRAPSATAASTAHVALLLASWGYRVIVRKVLHSKAYWTKSMDNTFIVALDSSSGNHVEYIVDPHFQEAFNVGVMSENYRCAVGLDATGCQGWVAKGVGGTTAAVCAREDDGWVGVLVMFWRC